MTQNSGIILSPPNTPPNIPSNIPPTPSTSSPINTNEYKCNVCQRKFKNKAGLTRHNTTIEKYNILRAGLPTIPTNLTELFKGDLVYFIHRRLPNGFKNAGKKTVSVACSESQFHAIFKNHIHFYSRKTGIYRCWFRGKEGEQKLTQIFGRANWGIKYYNQNQRTFVVLTDNQSLPEQTSSHVLDQKSEINPLAVAITKKLGAVALKSKKTSNKYKYGEMVVEWKNKHDKDANGNICSAGFIYFHFYTKQAYIYNFS